MSMMDFLRFLSSAPRAISIPAAEILPSFRTRRFFNFGLLKFHETEIGHKDSNGFFLKVLVPVFTRMNLKFLNQEVRLATL